MDLRLILSDSKFNQVSRSLLSILVDFNSAVVWMFSILPLISSFLQSLFQTSKDRSECTNDDWYHRHFHVPQFFQLSSKIQVIVYFSSFLFLLLLSVVHRNGNIYKMTSSLFLLLNNIRSGFLVRIWQSFVFQNPREFNESHFF